MRKQFREGNDDGVRAVYREYGRLVYAVAYRVLGDPGLAEEATQQTFLKAWRAASSIDDRRELAPWLMVIARRVAIDLYRREALRPTAALDAHAELAAREEAPEGLYDIWEVRQAVSELPPDEQEVVRLQHFEGLTHTQIGERLGLAVGTVKSRSYRAHRRLVAQLGHLRH